MISSGSDGNDYTIYSISYVQTQHAGDSHVARPVWQSESPKFWNGFQCYELLRQQSMRIMRPLASIVTNGSVVAIIN